jgi:hypothetical protein
MLLRMAYVSMAERPVEHRLIHKLLMDCRYNNRRDNITSMLFADAERFLQVIEGPAAVAEALWERLQRDLRHRCTVKILDEAGITERLYPDWSLGYTPLAPHELDDLLDRALRPLLHNNSGPSWIQQARLMAQLRGLTDANLSAQQQGHAA